MLFRIEDTENLQGCHRKYTLSLEDSIDRIAKSKEEIIKLILEEMNV